MAWGDGLAAIIGQRFGKHQYQIGTIKKSWEGSLAMTGAAFRGYSHNSVVYSRQ